MDVVSVNTLVTALDAAVQSRQIGQVTSRVKSELERLLGVGRLQLPDRFRQTRSDRYARRLLYRDPAQRYTVVVMAWAPEQHTSLHDHAGVWCVEAVVEGAMEATQFALITELEGKYQFAPSTSVRATVGVAGCLIPPLEYHVLTNALTDRPSVTLHVYGGELVSCNVFERGPDGWYERISRTLFYDD